MKPIRLAPLAFSLALIAGCGSPNNDRAAQGSSVTISATVDAYDPDGLLFDLVTNTREFDPGTIARGPLVRVVVTAPGNLAGRKYMITLPEEPAGKATLPGEKLRDRGAKVVFEMPRNLLSRAQHEIIEYTDLRWPGENSEPGSPARGNLR